MIYDCFQPPSVVSTSDIKGAVLYTLLSPWPDQRNGIADYAYEITRSGNAKVRLVSEALSPRHIPGKVNQESVEGFLTAPGQRRLYHFGNNPDHSFLVPLFLRHPGVVVIHDASLHYLAEKTDMAVPGFFRYAVTDQVGSKADMLFRLWSSGLKQIQDYTEVKCITWLKGASDVIVHSQYAKRMVAGSLPNSKIHVIPHFAYLYGGYNLARSRRAAARKALNVPEDTFVVSTLGFVTRHKQYDSVLRGISALGQKAHSVKYYIAGAVCLEEYDIDADIREANASGFVTKLGYVSEDAMETLLYASDLVINLRYPTFGESSGSTARALGAGAVLVVPEAGAFAEIPSETCFHVRSAKDVSKDITGIILSCLDQPEQLEYKRQAAIDYAYTQITPERCAARYEEILYGG